MISNETLLYTKCQKLGLEVEEYYYLLMMSSPGDNKEEIAKWNKKPYIEFIHNSLAEKGWIDLFDKNEFELMEQAKNLFTSEYAEELWARFPATFPLSGGANFIAKSGVKEAILELYTLKVSREEHPQIMQDLSKYIELVKARKINGNKIGDWVQGEMWNTVREIDLEETNFKTDI